MSVYSPSDDSSVFAPNSAAAIASAGEEFELNDAASDKNKPKGKPKPKPKPKPVSPVKAAPKPKPKPKPAPKPSNRPLGPYIPSRTPASTTRRGGNQDGSVDLSGKFDNGRGLNGQGTGKFTPGKNGGESLNGNLRYHSGSTGGAQNDINVNGNINRKTADGTIDGKLHLDGSHSDGRGDSESGKLDLSKNGDQYVIDASGKLVRKTSNGGTVTINGGTQRDGKGNWNWNGGAGYRSANGRNSIDGQRNNDGSFKFSGQGDNGQGFKSQFNGNAKGGEYQNFAGQLHYLSGTGMDISKVDFGGQFNRDLKKDQTSYGFNLDGSRTRPDGSSEAGKINFNSNNGLNKIDASGNIIRKNDRGDTFKLNGGFNAVGTGSNLNGRISGGASYESKDKKQGAGIQYDKDGKTTINGKFDNGAGLSGSGQLQIVPGLTGSANGKADISWNRRFGTDLSGRLNLQDRFSRSNSNGQWQNNLNLNGELRNKDRSDFGAFNFQRNEKGQNSWNAQGQLTEKLGDGWRGTLQGGAQQGITGPMTHQEKFILDKQRSQFDIGRDRNNIYSGNAVYRTTGFGADGHYQYNANNGKSAFQGGVNANWRLSDNWDAAATGRFSTTGSYSADISAINRNKRGNFGIQLSDQKFGIGGQLRDASNNFGVNGQYQANRVNGRTSFSGGFDAKGKLTDNTLGFANGQWSTDPNNRQATFGVMDLTEKNKLSLGINPREATLGAHYGSPNSNSNFDGTLSRRWSDGKLTGQVVADVRQPFGDSGFNGVLRGSYNTDRQGIIEGGIESQDRNKFLGAGMVNDWAYVRGRYAVNNRVDLNAGVARNVHNGQNFAAIGGTIKF